MRSKDESLMENIVYEADEFFSRYGRAPSTRELARETGVSHNTVARYLRDMAARGMLAYDGGTITTERIAKSSSESVNVPVLGSISCGAPLTEEGNVQAYVRLPTALIGRGEFFFVRANGYSMTGAGIDDGDLVLVRKTVEAKDGDVVVALVDGENTLKRIFFDGENRRVILHPENPTMSDIEVSGCEIQGVAVKILKDIGR